MAKTTTNGPDSPAGMPAGLVVRIQPDAGELDFSNVPSTLPTQAGALADAVPLAAVLSDALFGEVIDLSDMIPQFWSDLDHEGTAPTTSPQSLASATGFLPSEGTGPAAPHDFSVLNILYDEESLTAGHSL